MLQTTLQRTSQKKNPVWFSKLLWNSFQCHSNLATCSGFFASQGWGNAFGISQHHLPTSSEPKLGRCSNPNLSPLSARNPTIPVSPKTIRKTLKKKSSTAERSSSSTRAEVSTFSPTLESSTPLSRELRSCPRIPCSRSGPAPVTSPSDYWNLPGELLLLRLMGEWLMRFRCALRGSGCRIGSLWVCPPLVCVNSALSKQILFLAFCKHIL